MKGEIKVARNKKRLLKALEASLGIITTACKTAKVSRALYYDYIATDAVFKRDVELLDDVALDFAESSLLVQIRNNTPSSTIFYLKTKGKKRGYIEQVNVGGVANSPIQIVEMARDDYLNRAEALEAEDDC